MHTCACTRRTRVVDDQYAVFTDAEAADIELQIDGIALKLAFLYANTYTCTRKREDKRRER